MFFALGLKNVWRNRSRTVMGILSMAIATIVFVQATTLSQGYPSMAYFEARQLVGADIVIFPEKTALSHDDMASGSYIWKFTRRSFDRPAGTFGLDPWPFWYGQMQAETQGETSSAYEKCSAVMASLRDYPGIKQVSYKQAMPVLISVRDSQSSYYVYGFIEPRDPDADEDYWSMSRAVRSGRYLSAADAGTLNAVACWGWPGLNLPAGSEVSVEIPALRKLPGGSAILDYQNPVRLKLSIAGIASFTEGSQGSPYFTTYANPALFVHPQTFQDLASKAGFGPGDAVWGIGVTLKNLASLENIASELRRRFPSATVISVPSLAAALRQRSSVSPGIPMDMRRVTEVLIFATAALLLATNLSIIMVSRKNEIGILRSVGATSGNIAAMILAESVFTAFLGTLAGTLFMEPAVLWTLLSNKTPLAHAMARVLVDFGRALAFSSAAATLFGLIPVARALRITPAEVLRGK